MKLRLTPCVFLLLLATLPALHAQTLNSQGLNLSGATGTGCGSSTDDLDSSVGMDNGDCSDATLSQQNGTVSPDAVQTSVPQGANGYPTSGVPNRTLGMSGVENAPLNGISGEWQRVKLPPEKPSEFQLFVQQTTGQLLPVYGANLFTSVPSTFAPNNLAPVPSTYVIGPDDQLRIRIWGQINFSNNLRVNRAGDIYLPQVGAIHVAGLQSSELESHLHDAIGRLYRNFDLSVDVGQLRSIQVYLTGEARRPGAFTISSLSSLVDALFISGGPSRQGSLRHIEVRRNGQTITDFDLYDLLIRGDKSKDVPLLPEDVIYIPPVGPQVAITGSIRNPAIYEVRGKETIGDLLKMAGDISAMASNNRISLEHVVDHQRLQTMDFAFDAAGLAFPLSDGDIFRINPILPVYQQTVTLRGNVANPGHMAWKAGMHLSDLIPDRDSLQSRGYWWERSRLGLPGPTFQPDLNNAATAPPKSSQSQSPGAQSGAYGALAAQGTSANPTSAQGATPPADANANQQTAQGRAPAFSPSAAQSNAPKTTVQISTPQIDWNYAVIERTDPDTLRSSLIGFDLGKLVIDHDPSQNLALQPGDVVTIFSQNDIRIPMEKQTKYIDLEGEFAHPGYYSAQPGETLRDLVRRAGGFTSNAYLYGSTFTRESTRVSQQQRLDEYVETVRMDANRGTQAIIASGANGPNPTEIAASQAASQDLIARLSALRATGRIVLQFQPTSDGIDQVPAISLENGDNFVVPAMPATINVVGAVYDQNSFLAQSGRTFEYYLRMAGGPNRNADNGHAFVIRASGDVVSRSSNRDGGFWNSFNKLRLNPGDTIVVPDKTPRPTIMRSVIDWTTIFSQLALGVAAVQVLK